MAGSKTWSKEEKASAKNAKGQQKTSIKASGSSDTVSCPESAYNPMSETLNTLEIPLGASSPPFHDNDCFKQTGGTYEHSSSPHGTESEYDLVSNNWSCSGESQDSKDKVACPNHQDTVPGLDKDRREKTRHRNEKKHQRQKERRAQELHERCSRYLMSRKLEALSQQLVAMGFSYERATLALVLNDGKLEESVNWLFEGNEEIAQNKEARPGNTDLLKIDINEELAQISALELRYKCTRQEVERAIVACEGDLIKAEETLEAQKRELSATIPAPENSTDANSLKTMLDKSMSSAPILESANQAKAMAERRWPATRSSPTFSSPMATPMPVTPPLEVKLDASGNEASNQHQLVRGPVVVMQRPHSINAKQNQGLTIGAWPSVMAGWHPSNVPGAEKVMSYGKLFQNQSTTNLGVVSQRANQRYQPVSLTAPSSLGLFTGYGSSPPVDWNTSGSMPELDYTSIDWTLDSSFSPSKPNGLTGY